MPRVDEGYIEVPGGKVFYRIFGEGGVPLLALHGGPGFTMEYLDSLEDLADPGGEAIVGFADAEAAVLGDPLDEVDGPDVGRGLHRHGSRRGVRLLLG